MGIPAEVISADDVRRLLAGAPDSILVVIGGHTAVITPAELQRPDYRGALEVTTRTALIEQCGDTPSARDIEDQAAAWDTAVREIGG